MNEWEDEIINNSEIHLSFMDRIKVLFGKTIYVDGRIKCEHAPGRVQGENNAWVGRWFPTKSKPQQATAIN